MREEGSKVDFLFNALNERFPLEDFPPVPANRGLKQMYEMFCSEVAVIKTKRVLNLVAQHINMGKQMGRALADAMEILNEQERKEQ